MLIKAYAKLNLYLCVKKKKSNNLHEIESLFQNISLFDTIEIKEKTGDILYEGPEFDNNSILKVLKLLNITKGVYIKINKHIPQKAGLGGGSSDAAAVLSGVNELLKFNLSKEDLLKLASKIGSDVPFFLYGGTCLVGKTGEDIEKLEPLKDIKVLLFNSKKKISTTDAYQLFDANPIPCFGNIEKLYEKLQNKDFSKLKSLAFNSFDEIFSNESWEIEAKKTLKEFGGINPMLTGSGSSFFAYLGKKDEINTDKMKTVNFIDKGYEIDV